ncbi:hypothetical protein ACEE96_00280 [Staphylococcus simulans]|uniref:hypothetical protein n=2 Tax=unclassified Staphylococcus TaxID=91994 RepID=UPI000DF7B035|nr:hypothetical protein [Staphylococcus sp. EZ-P03]
MNSQHALLPLPQNYKELFAIFVTRNEFIQFEKRIDSQFMNLNEKIDALDAKVNDIHQSLDTKIDERFNTLDAKIDERFNTLDRKFDYKFNTLDGRMTKLETKFDDFQKNSNTQFKWLITTMLSMILVVLGVLTYFI